MRCSCSRSIPTISTSSCGSITTWTLGEAFAEGLDRIPFISKEVWLDDSRPGEVTLVFVWESMESWRKVGGKPLQRDLQARFDRDFAHRIRLVRALDEEADRGLHRWSRFEWTHRDDRGPGSDPSHPPDPPAGGVST